MLFTLRQFQQQSNVIVRVTGLLFLFVFPTCTSNVPRSEFFKPIEYSQHWTAEDVRRLRPRLLDFSQPACKIDATPTRKFLLVRILDRADEVMSVIRETMDFYGFVPLPEYPGITSENKYILPDDIYSCFYTWYGLGTDYIMLAQYFRCLPDYLRAFGPPRVWYRDEFRQLLLSKLQENGLSNSSMIGYTSFADRPRSQNEDILTKDFLTRSISRCSCLLMNRCSAN